MRRLPPLPSLRAFEAAARHLSFKRAAEELYVTPTAISHQIRQLEDWLGVRLFERRTRQVLMTEAGQRLYPVLRDGFDAFAAAVESLRPASGRQVVTLTTTPALTAHWLVPRMARFQRDHPEIDLRLLATERVVNIAAGEADLAIRYGTGQSPGLTVQPLLRDAFFPMSRPDVTVAGEIGGATLIHYDWALPAPEQPTWPRWFEVAGVRPSEQPQTLHFSDEAHAVLAAMAGQGVALLSRVVAADALASGTLVVLSPVFLPGRHYCLLHGDESLAGPAALVRDWLMAEAARTERDLASRCGTGD